MSLPSQNTSAGPPRAQSSIRSFFQPTLPKYAAPPSALRPQNTPPPPPPSAAAETIEKQPPSSQKHGAAISTIPPPPPPPPAVAIRATDVPATVPVPAPKKTHHPNITISPILPSHISSLRHLTARLLQVRYPDSFYDSLSDPARAYSRVLLWTDGPNGGSGGPSSSSSKPTVIGGLVCRASGTFQGRPGSAQDLIPDALYVQSLVLQEPYRGLGLAALLLDEICALAARGSGCRTVCAHVWTENDEGLAWYTKRGFTPVEPVVAEYYRQLKPAGAWIVRREIPTPGAVLNALAQSQQDGSEAQRKQLEGDAAPLPPRVTAAPSTASTSSPLPPPPPSAAGAGVARPSPITGTSYQNTRPETEWNDLPVDMQVSSRNASSVNLALPPSGTSSGTSSRSSSTMRKKRDRAYPAAAFGN
ncbi:hypothetical protein BX600DRAFT_317249 [Xylariales sp. PMI_506]|nr:hypothetical protein BX600DRAFT_317249 [Xylariales sp. PMI_506]